MPNYHHFHPNLKALRIRSGATQADMADTLGIPRSTYSAYENGIAEPNLDTLVKLQDHFNIGADVLLNAKLHGYSKEELEAAQPAMRPRPRIGYHMG
jgi:DNA-binding XRE family transcriptional regulator